MAVRTADGAYPPIDGVEPQIDPYGIAEYRGLHVPTPFTGKVRLGKDFIQDLYIHMGFQKATAFQTVLDFVFESGQLVSTADISERVARKRGVFKERFGRGDILKDIEDAFSLDMDIE
jgi:hypothetical protein